MRLHRLVIGATLAAAPMIAILAFSMPADGFFSGDPGVKLIAAFNAVEHPLRPFDIDLPAIAGTPTTYVERFFWLHGDHSHVVQSPVFPVLSAPFVSMFGLRGAYLMPAVAFLALIPLLSSVFRAVAPDGPLWMYLLIAIAANPIFLYALEFWEHAPAVALLAAATSLMWRRPVTHRRAIGAGFWTATAIVLRPEGALYAVGLAVISGWRAGRWYAVGIAVLLLPAALLNYAAFGTPLGPHAAVALAPLTDRWLDARLHRFMLWLVPSSALALIGFGVIAVAHLARATRLPTAQRQLAALAGGALIAFASASGQLVRDNLWQAWPAGVFVLAYVGGKRSREPSSGTRQDEHDSRPLFLIAGITFLLVILTSAHDGGAQWGPRFLLIATPALILSSACAAAELWTQSGRWQFARRALIIIVLAASVFVSRNAFREMRASKRYYARLTEATAHLVPDGGYVLTNVWWFDQITAPLYGRHTVLNVTTPRQAESALRDLQNHGVRQAVLVTAPDEPATVVAGAVGRGNCFVPIASEHVRERQVTFTKVGCR